MGTKNIKIVSCMLIIFVSSLNFAFAEDLLLLESMESSESTASFVERKLAPGRFDAFGTYFEITDSDYLNIAVGTDVDVKLAIESVPETVTYISTVERSIPVAGKFSFNLI